MQQWGVDDAVREIAENCTLVRLRMLARTVSGIYQREMRSCGLGVSQVNILVCVGHVGACAPGEVARMMQMQRSTVSRTLRPLLGAGFLAGEEDEGGRLARVRLTAAGRARLRQVLPAWRRAQAKVTAALGTSGVGELKMLEAKSRSAKAP